MRYELTLWLIRMLIKDARQLKRRDAQRASRRKVRVTAFPRNVEKPPISPLKTPTGEATGPTKQADSQGNIIGCVPSRGEEDVFQRAAIQPRDSFPQTFVIESFVARELISVLTRGANEEMHFLTGPKLGPIRIVSRWASPVSLERQSPVFVRASAKSVAAVLIPIIEQGAELHICAHSHPGQGAGATTPSGTDIECLGKLQKAGSQAIGCIVTRDGCVRFFSVSTKFHVMILGTGTKEISDNVFHITPQDRY